MATLERIFLSVVHASWQAGVIAVLVMLVLLCAGRWIPARGKCALWMLVAIRLVMPVLPGSSWSVFNLVRAGVEEKSAKPASGETGNAGVTVKVVYGEVPGGFAPAREEVVQVANAPTLSSPSPLPSPEGRGSKSAIAIVWCAVGIALFARLIVRAILFGRRVRKFERIEDEKLLNLLDESCQRMNVRSRVDLRWADGLAGPALMGIFAPKILLPRGIVTRLDDEEIRFIFLHELAHLKRRDILVDCAMAILQIVHWFNPFVWYAMHRRRAERELVCDAQVLSVCGRGRRRRYGGAIVKLIEKLGPTQAPPVAVGIAENKTELTRRITMIAEFRKTSVGRSVLAMVVVLLVGCVGLTDAAGGDSEKAAEKSAKPQPAVASTAPAQSPAAQDNGSHRMVSDVKTAAQLDRNLPEINFQAIGLSDVVDFLRDVTGANVFVNWRALEAVGIDRNAPVTARMRDVKFSKALQTILDDVGGGTVALGYTIDEGVLTISTEEDLSKNVITKVYDVRDLLASAKDSSNDPFAKKDGSAAAEKPTTQSSTRTLIESITLLITETVAPDSWREAGGTVGAIRELQGNLIITQTPQNQEAIEQLLDQLHEARGQQVRIEARFIALDEASLPTLSPKLKRKIGGELQASDPTFGEDKELKAVVLTHDEVGEVLKAIQSSKETSMLAAPRITLFNGQHAFVSVGTATSYISDYTMTKTAAGETRYEPRTATVDAGMTFDISGTLSADRKYITLGLHPTLKTLTGMTSEPYAGAPGEKLTVQKPQLKVSELQTTASIPDGGTLVLGGMSADSFLGQEKGSSKQLLLLVNANVIPYEAGKAVPLLSTKISE